MTRRCGWGSGGRAEPTFEDVSDSDGCCRFRQVSVGGGCGWAADGREGAGERDGDGLVDDIGDGTGAAGGEGGAKHAWNSPELRVGLHGRVREEVLEDLTVCWA